MMQNLILHLEVDATWTRRALWVIKPLCWVGLPSVDAGARLAAKLVRIKVRDGAE